MYFIKWNYWLSWGFLILPYKCYGPSVSNVIVTKREPLGSSGLYKTSGTIGWGVAKLYNYIYTKCSNVLIYLYTKYTNIPTYSVITIGRSYIFKEIQFLPLDSSLFYNKF